MNALKEKIRPYSELETKLEELREQCREEDCAVILARDGQADTVLISYDAYRKMSARLTVLEMLAEAEGDVRDGRTAPTDQTFREIREEMTGTV